MHYVAIPGQVLTTALYLGLTKTQQARLAEDIAEFVVKLQRQVPIELARSLGFATTTWPLNPDVLEKHARRLLPTSKVSFFNDFITNYTLMLSQPHAEVFLHHDLHGGNMLVHPKTGRLQGVIDFNDTALDDPWQEFRLLKEIDMHLMDSVADAYGIATKHGVDSEAVRLYYLATEFSRLAEIAQGEPTGHEIDDILARLVLYQKIGKARVVEGWE